MSALRLFHEDGKPSNVWYCSKCKMTAPSEELAQFCCEPRACECGTIIEAKYYTKCNACRQKDEDAKELAKFDAAEKVSDWKGPVYSEGVGYNDGYFRDLDALYEDVEADDLPDYVWCCDETQVVDLDAGNVLDNLEFAEEQDEHDLKGIKELQVAFDAFNEANKDVVTWYPNYKKAYVIRTEESN